MPTLDQLRERQEVEDVVVRVFVATDRRDWASVEACLADIVILDMTSTAGGEPLHMKPIDLFRFNLKFIEGNRELEKVT